MVANSRVAAQMQSLAAPRVRLGSAVALVSLVVGSAVVRALAAVAHATPAYFPDEYIYASIGRSLAASGRPLVRGGPAHFPALLEPLAAAPIWALASVQTAYHLIQVENAIFVSLAALPVYALARRLELGSGYALAAAAFAVAVPDAGFGAYMLADPLGYLLALTALYAGVAALQRPGAGRDVAFMALATLATLARVQYVVLVPAFAVAALVLERRRTLRMHAWPFALLGAGVAGVLAFGTSRVLGYYSTLGTDVGTGFLKWLGLELFFFALAGGVVLGPAAVAGLLSGGDRRDRAFTAFVVPFALAVLFEGALYASNNELPRFKERYLMVLLPLVPLAFGLYLRRGRPGRLLVTVLAAAVAALAALLPLSGYAAGTGFDDSPLLWAFTTTRWQLGIANSSLVFAGYATVGAVLAGAIAWGRLGRAALGLALVAVAGLSVGATRFDLEYSRQIRDHLTDRNPSWVDAARLGPVTAIQTDLAPQAVLLQQLFWNRSITREVLLGKSAIPTDAFDAPRIAVGRDGVLRVRGRPLRTAILFQGMQVTPVFLGLEQVTRFGSFTLWRPTGTPRLRVLEVGRFGDGWLGVTGILHVWPGRSRRGTVSFTLSLDRRAPTPVVMRFGTRRFRLAPGGHVAVRLPVDGARPWSTRLAVVSGASVLADQRPVSVRSTVPVYTPR